ncbi:hypothetical protein [Mesorhizobium sp. B263B2A]|uniref:hypothetical protein n=1 Tax=Mesorhizobium sp. B263B2A TaxID=2876669 RepID=UPI001CD097F0|nr:hypothetical protein [Mesorhizobium sp. B263B2A]MCA0032704.1 hypothetical protein [Mesorhizobium sp. B263B2A]
MSPTNPHLSSMKMDWPTEFLDLIRERAAEEDENVSAFIRKIIAAHIEWTGPTRNIRDYAPAGAP